MKCPDSDYQDREFTAMIREAFVEQSIPDRPTNVEAFQPSAGNPFHAKPRHEPSVKHAAWHTLFVPAPAIVATIFVVAVCWRSFFAFPAADHRAEVLADVTPAEIDVQTDTVPHPADEGVGVQVPAQEPVPTVYFIKYVLARDVAKEVKRNLAGEKFALKVDERLNALIVKADDKIQTRIENQISQMDVSKSKPQKIHGLPIGSDSPTDGSSKELADKLGDEKIEFQESSDGTVIASEDPKAMGEAKAFLDALRGRQRQKQSRILKFVRATNKSLDENRLDPENLAKILLDDDHRLQDPAKLIESIGLPLLVRSVDESVLETDQWLVGSNTVAFTYEIDATRVIDGLRKLVDELLGQRGLLDEIMAGMLKDPHGPKINMTQLITGLGERWVVVCDKHSEQFLVAFPAIIPEARQAIRNLVTSELIEKQATRNDDFFVSPKHSIAYGFRKQALIVGSAPMVKAIFDPASP